MEVETLKYGYYVFMNHNTYGQNCWDNSCFPHPPTAMLICHGLRNQDPFIDCSHVSTLSGGKGGAKKAAKEENALPI